MKLFRKILAIIIIVGLASLSIAFNVSADDNPDTTDSILKNDCRTFLGLISWDCNTGLTDSSSQITEDELKSGVLVAGANVATDITIAATYLVLGFVIYGGYLYTFSAGDPTKVANGKKTLARAFLGLAIVLSAHIILNSIRIALGANFTENCAMYECVAPSTMILGTIDWFIGIAGFVSAIFVVYGGVSYMTSSGDTAKTQKAKQIILYALIGLAIVALSATITAFVSSKIREANDNTSLINETSTAKEVYEINII